MPLKQKKDLEYSSFVIFVVRIILTTNSTNLHE